MLLSFGMFIFSLGLIFPFEYSYGVGNPQEMIEYDDSVVTVDPAKSVELVPHTTMENDTRNHIYILLVGLSGSGKSSTINMLFNTTVAAVGNTESTTSEIFEYSLGQSDSSGTELRLIDTPGLEDTRGLENDAKFLATMEEFLNNHNTLSQRPPDVVLICARFDDNRFYGESSKFVKMLRSIGVLQSQIVNPKYSNLIFVLTHLMGVTEKEAKNPQKKMTTVENTIKEFSLFPNPIKIVLAENKGEENELERAEYGYVLPNGEIYPQNLCSAIKQILSLDSKNANKIELMSSVCSQGGVDSDNLRLVSETDLVPNGNLRAAKLLEVLTAANLKTEDTEISRHLKNTFENLTEKGNLPSDSLILIQKALHLRRITKLSDIPKTDSEIASLFRDLQKNKGIEIIWKAAFGITPPNLNIESIIGGCYDIISDSVLQANPFQINTGMYNLSDIGFLTPSTVVLNLDSHIKYFNHKSTSEEDYIKNRFLFLGVEEYADLVCKAIIKPGFNIVTRGSCPSLLIEFRTIRLDKDTSELNPTFLSQIMQLPNFDISVPDSIQRWNTFLTAYGSHVITSAFGGGSIEVIIENYPCNALDPKEVYEQLIAQGDTSVLTKIINFTKLKISGGDPKLYSENPEMFFGGKGTTLFEKWKDSLTKFPTILYNDIKLMALENIIKSQDSSLILTQVKKAQKFFRGEKIGPHPLLIRLNEIESLKSDLQTDLDTLTITKSNLENTIEQLNKTKGEMDSRNVDLRRQLEIEEELNSNTATDLLKEVQDGSEQTVKIEALKHEIAEVQREVDNERSRSQTLRQVFDYSKTATQATNRDNRCGETFNTEEGVIIYKIFSEYSNNERCVWIIRIPSTYTQIKFNLAPTNFETGNDYITIFSFNKEGHKQSVDMGKSNNEASSVTLNGFVAVVVFTTDYSVVNKGFALYFKALGKTDKTNYEYSFNNIFSSSSGTLLHPSDYPNPYRNNEMSVFVFSNSFLSNLRNDFPNFKLKISWINTEKCNSDCTCDRLLIYQMERDTLTRRIRDCGENYSDREFVAKDLFIVVFATDGSVNKSGFRLYWSLS